MSVPKVLSSDDIEELAESVAEASDPLTVATTLIAAVDEERLAEPADAAGALLLAAEIHEFTEDLATALTLADRAVEASVPYGEVESGVPRAYRAELLAQLGREEEAMTELVALRPLLTRDEEAPEYLSAALTALNRTELAEEWLTEGLREVMAEVKAESVTDVVASGEEQEPAVAIMFALLEQRHALRHELDLPHDEYDDLAESVEQAIEEIEEKLAHTPVPYWPENEFEELRRRWPAVAAEYGASWKEHREDVQTLLSEWAESDRSVPPIVRFSVDELTEFAAKTGGDPATVEACRAYAEMSANAGRVVSWPPERNEVCWCGSDLKYKKCCLVRFR